jgi:hypothetical protein
MGGMSETVTINGREFNLVSSTPMGAKNAHMPKRKAHRIIPRPLDGEPVSRGTLTLSLAPPSVNSLFANARKGRRKTLAYANWLAASSAELRRQDSWHVPGRVRITIRSNAGSDIDNRNKAALDCLVSLGRIEGDSPKHVIECRSIHDSTITGTLIEIERAA